MTIQQVIQTIRTNRKYFSISAIANEIGYDVSNMHKVINGTFNLPEKYHKKTLKIFTQIFGSVK